MLSVHTETGSGFRDVSHSLYRLISGLAQPQDPPTGGNSDSGEPNDRTQRLRARAHGYRLQNCEGSFCWHEHCEGCSSLTKAAQSAAIALTKVADLYTANVSLIVTAMGTALTCRQAEEVLLQPQEVLVEMSLPSQRQQVSTDSPNRSVKLTMLQPLLRNHLAATEQLERLLTERDEEKIEPIERLELRTRRCEAALSALQAEMEHVHDQHQEKLRFTSKSLLDSQIAFHTSALAQLQAARACFDDPQYADLAQEGIRLPPFLERNALAEPRLLEPLRQPTSWGLPPSDPTSGLLQMDSWGSAFSGAAQTFRSAASAIRAQTQLTGKPSSSADLASPSRFAQFLSWQINARGEERRHIR